MRRAVWVIALLALAAPARAGRRPFTLAYDAQSVPEGDVEMEMWLDFLGNRHTRDAWRWWVGPCWAPVASVEVTALTAFAQTVTSPEGGDSVTQLWAELLEARWHALSSEKI